MEFRNGTIGGEENGLVGAFPIERLRKDCRLAVRPHNPDRTIAEMPGEEMVSFHGDEQPGASQVVGYASEQPGRFLQHIANRFVHILFDDGSILLGKGFVKLVAKEPACTVTVCISTPWDHLSRLMSGWILPDRVHCDVTRRSLQRLLDAPDVLGPLLVRGMGVVPPIPYAALFFRERIKEYDDPFA